MVALIGMYGYFRVFIARGYYDLNIGYTASRYDIDHTALPTDLRRNVTLRYYKSGHQIYVRQDSRKALGADIHEFLKTDVNQP